MDCCRRWILASRGGLVGLRFRFFCVRGPVTSILVFFREGIHEAHIFRPVGWSIHFRWLWNYRHRTWIALSKMRSVSMRKSKCWLWPRCWVYCLRGYASFCSFFSRTHRLPSFCWFRRFRRLVSVRERRVSACRSCDWWVIIIRRKLGLENVQNA